LSLTKPVAPKETIEVTVGYEGTIPQDSTRLTRIGVPSEVAKHSDWDQISASFTVVRGIGYVAWYPIATEVANMSDAASITEAVGRWKQREHDAEMKVCMPGEAFMNDDSHGVPGAKLSGDTTGNSFGCVQHSFLGGTDTVPLFGMAELTEAQSGNISIRYSADHKSAADDYILALTQVSPSVSV